MNISIIEVAKACIFMLIGAFLCKQFMPEPSQNQPAIEAKANSEAMSNANAKCIVKKTTDSKGNVTETIEANTNSADSAKSEASILIPTTKSSSLDIFIGAGVNTDLKPYGSLEFIKDKNAVELKSDFNKDHSIYYKRKVFEWR